MRRLAIATLALALSACAQSAVLEVQVMLPPRPADAMAPRFALVQVRRAADHPFEIDWLGQELPAVELGAAETRTQISVVTENAATDVHVKVRFCVSPSCDALADGAPPERWYAIERPFYLGRRTSWAACIASVPSAAPSEPTRVGRCEVRGCARATGSSTNCSGGGSGAHFCETGSQDEPPRELRCIGETPDY